MVANKRQNYDFETPDENSDIDSTGYTICFSLLNNKSCSLNTTESTDFSHYYDDDISGFATELALVTLFYGITLVLGVIGNGLVIFTILRIRRMQSVTNVFLTSLATADLLLILICVPIKHAKWFSFTWEYGRFLCKAVHYSQNVMIICSTLTLTAMSMERYYAICHPMQAKYKCTVRRTRKIIVALWLFSFLLATPILYGQKLIVVGIPPRQGFWCTPEWSSDVEKVYELFMLVLVLILPLTIMVFAYTKICLALWTVGPTRTQYNRVKQKSRQENSIDNKVTAQVLLASQANNGRTEMRKQVIKMLVTIILLFTICWAPALIDNVLVAFKYVQRLNYGYLKPMRQAFDVMSYFNSCVNPIVYAFMSKHWRRSFKLALCSCFTNSNSNRYYGNQFWNHTTHQNISTTGGQQSLASSSYTANGKYLTQICDATEL